MQIELKRAIIDHILDNLDEFELVNNTVNAFSPYIYNGAGEHLIGGKQVYEFIGQAIKLIKEF